MPMNKLTELLEEILEVPVETLDENAEFREVAEWDSLKHVRLVLGIQSEFGIDLDRDEIQRLTGLSQVRTVLSDHGVSG